MQLKITAHFVFFICFVSSLRGKAIYPKGCYECEEEVWEEVPCDDIPSNSTTVSTPSYSTTPTFKPTTPSPKPTTTTGKYTTTTRSPPTSESYPTTSSPEYTTPNDPYQKCYCECKIGCKEFCRKVVINSPDKQIVQVSKISEPVEEGHIESTHFLQREYIPKSDQSFDKPDDYAPSYDDNDDEPDNDKYLKYDGPTRPSLPLSTISKYEEGLEPATYHTKPNIPALEYFSKPISHPIAPIHHGPYATAEAGINNFRSYASYPPNPPHTSYYSPPNSGSYNFPIPLENVFSKVSKTLLDPVERVQISLDASGRKDPSLAYSKCPSYSLPSYSSPTPAKDSQLETRGSLGNDINFDDSFDSIIKEFLSSNPSNEAQYPAFPNKPLYSVSYSR